jgi:hypothetical protein
MPSAHRTARRPVESSEHAVAPVFRLTPCESGEVIGDDLVAGRGDLSPGVVTDDSGFGLGGVLDGAEQPVASVVDDYIESAEALVRGGDRGKGALRVEVGSRG